MTTAKSSEVILYQSVGAIDSTYENVIYNTQITKIITYLNNVGTKSYSGTALSYIKPDSGKCKCTGSLTSAIKSSSYMLFINKSHENRYFFAFVKQVNYINDNTFEIEFELDLFHSYISSANFKSCFIERQHSKTDEIGDNLQPEPQFTNLDYTATAKYIDLGLRYALVTTSDGDGAIKMSYNSAGEIISGNITIYNDVATFVNAVLDLVSAGKAETIITACYYPNTTDTAVTIDRPATINGYTPKNNKCLSGLFVKLIATNNLGAKQCYTFERGLNGSITFNLKSTLSIPPAVMLYPNTYDTQIDNTISGLVYDNYPLVPLIKDSYFEYLNNTSAQRNSNVIMQGLGGVCNALTLNLGAAANNVSNLMSVEANMYDLANSSTRYQVNSSSANGLLNIANNASGTNNMRGFTLFLNIPRATEIQLIDNYFTRYGYAQNNVTTPNLMARPYWTYIKTRNCNIIGAMPDTARQVITNVLNKGTTVWKGNCMVGDFTLDNSV